MQGGISQRGRTVEEKERNIMLNVFPLGYMHVELKLMVIVGVLP